MCVFSLSSDGPWSAFGMDGLKNFLRKPIGPVWGVSTDEGIAQKVYLGSRGYISICRIEGLGVRVFPK